MSIFETRGADDCRWDLVALGEVMLRLDPGEGRIATTRSFEACEGGGEYNVARGLRRCFGLRTAARDRAGRQPRRPPHRGPHAAGRRRPEPRALGGLRRRRAHGAQRAQLHRARLRRARRRGLLRPRPHGRLAAASRRRRLGRDLRRRGRPLVPLRRHLRGPGRARPPRSPPRPWRRPGATARSSPTTSTTGPRCGASIGGQERAREVNRGDRAARRRDARQRRGLQRRPRLRGRRRRRRPVGARPERFGAHDGPGRARRTRTSASWPRPCAPCASASRNDWSAVCWADGTPATARCQRPGLEILDRVGGGDSFASGLIYGLLSGLEPQQALEYGAAHGALAMTTPGDTSMATLAEVEALVRGASARVQR